MSDDNKWSKPDAPPPPLFLGKKERDLVKQVNDELIEKVIGQQILYYSIDLRATKFHGFMRWLSLQIILLNTWKVPE